MAETQSSSEAMEGLKTSVGISGDAAVGIARGFIDGEYTDGEVRGIVFVAGMRGMGKTTELHRLLQQCQGGALFFDSISKHSFPGWVVISQPGKLKKYLAKNHARRFRILYQPRTGDSTEHFRAVCRIVKAYGWMALGIDELDKHCDSHFGSTRMPEELYDLVNYGRHYRVSMVATARYPQSVARGFISQWESMRLFRMQDPEHVAYFSKLCGSVAVRELQTLKPYEFLLCRQGDSGAKKHGGKRA